MCDRSSTIYEFWDQVLTGFFYNGMLSPYITHLTTLSLSHQQGHSGPSGQQTHLSLAFSHLHQGTSHVNEEAILGVDPPVPTVGPLVIWVTPNWGIRHRRGEASHSLLVLFHSIKFGVVCYTATVTGTGYFHWVIRDELTKWAQGGSTCQLKGTTHVKAYRTSETGVITCTGWREDWSKTRLKKSTGVGIGSLICFSKAYIGFVSTHAHLAAVPQFPMVHPCPDDFWVTHAIVTQYCHIQYLRYHV